MYRRPKLLATIGQNSNSRTVRMSEPEQVLIFEPNAVHFHGPIRQTEVRAELVVTNPTRTRVVFTAQTNAPRRYFVDPSRGIVEPKSKKKILISLMPNLIDDESPVFRDTDKFRIISMIVPRYVDRNLQDADKVWCDSLPGIEMKSTLPCVLTNALCDDDIQWKSTQDRYNERDQVDFWGTPVENDNPNNKTSDDNNDDDYMVCGDELKRTTDLVNRVKMEMKDEVIAEVKNQVEDQLKNQMKDPLKLEFAHKLKVLEKQTEDQIVNQVVQISKEMYLRAKNINKLLVTAILLNNLILIILFVVYETIDRWFASIWCLSERDCNKYVIDMIGHNLAHFFVHN